MGHLSSRLLSFLIPARWRASVLRDLTEESSRWPRLLRPLRLVSQLLGIAIRLRLRTVASTTPSFEGVFTGFSRDVLGAVRHLRRSPASTTIAIVTLSLAVAAVVTVMAIVDRTVLRPLPFGNAHQLVGVYRVDPALPANWLFTAGGDVVDWRRDSRSFSSLASARNTSMAYTALDAGGAPLMRAVTHDWFDTLQVTPLAGRDFTEAEDRPNGPKVAMLSYATWQSRFGARQDMVGQTVEMDRMSFTIVGILPSTYHNPVFALVDEPEVFVPLGLAEAGEPRSPNTLLTIGRLAPGVSVEAAREDIARQSEAQALAYPETNRQFRATVQPLDEQLVRPLRTPLTLLMLVVMGLFVAACGNVANLTLVRALARRQQYAVQLALGASRLRLVLQALTECVLVALPAGALAVMLASIAGPAAQRLAPPGFLAPTLLFSLEPRVLVVAGLISIVAAVLTALPAVIASGRSLSDGELGAGVMRSIGSAGGKRLGSGLVAAEVTIATVLLAGAGLAATGLQSLRSSPIGFVAEDAVTFRVSTRGPQYATPESRVQFFDRLLDDFRALPGVTAAAGMNALPIFAQFGARAAYRADIADVPAPGQEPRVVVNPITDGFFLAMGIALRDGRDFAPTDRLDTPPVVVLSRTAATRLFGDSPPLNRSVILLDGTRQRRVEVVGLVDDVRSATDPTSYTPIAYVPVRQTPPAPALGFVLRSTESPATLHRQAEAAVHRINRTLPLYQFRPMTEVAAALEATSRFTSALLTVFALLGAALVASGLYGTLAHLVEQRRREMGVRVALGASRGGVLRLVLTDGLRPAVIGLALGWVGALGFGQVIARSVAGTPAFQWALFLALPAALLVLSAFASLVPALRATRVDPTIALRN